MFIPTTCKSKEKNSPVVNSSRKIKTIPNPRPALSQMRRALSNEKPAKHALVKF
jgi:hypothetical protein